jgi:hypothetical protein
MPAPRDEISRFWCGKINYPNYQAALRGAMEINKRKGGDSTAYYCTTCLAFHFGCKRIQEDKTAAELKEWKDKMLQILEKHKSAAAPIISTRAVSEIQDTRELSWVAQRVAKGREAPFSEIATITPAIARHLLENNPDNRAISETQVALIASDIKSGRWQLNGETIIVAKDGSLNDGQNRLSAVVEANEPIQTVIMFGVSRSSRLTVDMGRQRTAGNFLAMSGVKYANHVASAISLLMRFNRGAFSGGGTRELSRVITKQDIRAEYEKRSKSVSRAADELVNDRFAKLAGLPAMMCAHMILWERNPVQAGVFFARLLDGAQLKKGDSILWLRQRLMDARGAGLRTDHRLEIILLYWNAWRTGKTLTRHIYTKNTFPAVEG